MYIEDVELVLEMFANLRLRACLILMRVCESSCNLLLPETSGVAIAILIHLVAYFLVVIGRRPSRISLSNFVFW